MGLWDNVFGCSTRTMDGYVWAIKSEHARQEDAATWANYYNKSGYISKVYPNSSRQCFEVLLAIKQLETKQKPPEVKPNE